MEAIIVGQWKHINMVSSAEESKVYINNKPVVSKKGRASGMEIICNKVKLLNP